MFIKRQLKNFDLKNLIVYLLIGGICLLYLIGVLLRHFRLESFGYDLGIFAQEIYLLSKFKLPFSTIKIPNMIIWGDHWTPSLIIFVPFVWLFSRPELVLIVFQVIFLAFGAWIIWCISKEKTKDFLFSFTLVFVFLLFYGIQNAIFFDAHPFFFASMLVPALYLLFLKEKWGLFFLVSFLMANFKEDIPLYLIAFGIYLLIKRKYKQGLAMFAFYFIWFILLTKFLIPYFSPLKTFAYSQEIPIGFELLKRLIFPFQKIKVVLVSFWNYSFLPVFSPFSLLLSLVNFGTNFLGEGALAGRWGFDRHYKAILGPVLAIGAVETYLFLKERRFNFNKSFRKIILGNMIFAAVFIQDFLNLQLNMLVKKEYWRIGSHKKAVLIIINDFKNRKGSIATQNNLVPHLSAHSNIYILSYKYEDRCQFNEGDFDYIFVDLAPYQTEVNFLGCSSKEVKDWLVGKLKEGKYKTLISKEEIYLLEKNF